MNCAVNWAFVILSCIPSECWSSFPELIIVICLFILFILCCGWLSCFKGFYFPPGVWSLCSCCSGVRSAGLGSACSHAGRTVVWAGVALTVSSPDRGKLWSFHDASRMFCCFQQCPEAHVPQNNSVRCGILLRDSSRIRVWCWFWPEGYSSEPLLILFSPETSQALGFSFCVMNLLVFP